MIRERYTQVHLVKAAYTRRLTDQKECITYTHNFTEEKARTCWKSKFWFTVFGPWYLVRGIDPKYWVQGIDPAWFWTMILREA